MNKFKVGDRVKSRFGSGTVVFNDECNMPLVEHDVWRGGHEGASSGVPKGTCKQNAGFWINEVDLTLLEDKQDKLINNKPYKVINSYVWGVVEWEHEATRINDKGEEERYIQNTRIHKPLFINKDEAKGKRLKLIKTKPLRGELSLLKFPVDGKQRDDVVVINLNKVV